MLLFVYLFTCDVMESNCESSVLMYLYLNISIFW